MNIKAAQKLFTVSIIYLTLLQITYLIDKIYIWI
jgi:heme O synthase-like polyprenyltransferase